MTRHSKYYRQTRKVLASSDAKSKVQHQRFLPDLGSIINPRPDAQVHQINTGPHSNAKVASSQKLVLK